MSVAKCVFTVYVKITLAKYLLMLLCGITVLLICGDVELNLGPKKTKSYHNFYFFLIYSRIFIQAVYTSYLWSEINDSFIHKYIHTSVKIHLLLCHWNLNSITAPNFSKILLLGAYNVQHKFDMICISEAYLD